MKSYFLCATQPSNLGDLIINKMLVKELSKYGSVYVDCKNTPRNFANYLTEGDDIFETDKSYGVSLKSGRLINWCHFIKSRGINIYVSSPGPIGSNNKTLLRVYFQLIERLLRTNKIQQYYIGNCCSQVLADNKHISFSNKRMAYLRSKECVRKLKESGASNVSYIPDLAYLLHQYVKPSIKEKVAIFSFRDVNVDFQHFNHTLCTMVCNLLQLGFKVEFYYQVAADRKFNESLAKQFSSSKVFFREEMVWYDSLNYFADKMFVISNRLHSLITGAIYDVIPLALVNNESKVSKIEDVFYSSLTHPQIHIAHNGDALVLDNLIENYDSVRDVLAKDVENNCLECIKVINNIVCEYI